MKPCKMSKLQSDVAEYMQALAVPAGLKFNPNLHGATGNEVLEDFRTNYRLRHRLSGIVVLTVLWRKGFLVKTNFKRDKGKIWLWKEKIPA